jgi:hypothetical protein
MKASRRKHRTRDRGPGAPGERSVRQPVRRGPRRHPVEVWGPIGLVAFGAMLLAKVAATLMEGTAWDDLERVSRDGDPLAYWMFVGTYGVMGLGLVWWGVSEWRRPR